MPSLARPLADPGQLAASPFETRASRAPQGEVACKYSGFPHPEEGRRPVSKDEEIGSMPNAIALDGDAHGMPKPS